MIKHKTFKLTDKATLNVRADKIVATVHGPNGIVDIYCADKEIPFHIEPAENTSAETIVNYIWED